MSAFVKIRGKYPPGSVVSLYRVASVHTLRVGADAELVAEAQADADGTVTFTDGVQLDARYIARGVADGFPLELRARAVEEEPADALEAKITPDREQVIREPNRTPTAEATARRQQDVVGVAQRSDTAHGTASPVG